jgi:hypothetical protein
MFSFYAHETVTKGASAILANVEVPPAMLENLQKIVEQSRANDLYLFDFTAENLLLHNFIQLTFTDDGNGEGHIPRSSLQIPESLQPLLPKITEQKKLALYRLKRRPTVKLIDLHFILLTGAARMTALQFQSNYYLHKEKLELITNGNAFISVFGPSFNDLLNASYRSKTDSEALIAILAIFRYKAEKGQLPSSLETLVSQHYLKTLPQDSYSSGSLVYKRTDNGFLLYSLGADFDDDGATPSEWGDGEKGGDQLFWPVEGTDGYMRLINEIQLK